MTKHEKIQKITLTAILAALVVVIAFLPIKTLGLEITLTVIPIAIGAILGGSVVGSILGTVFGIVSFLQCLGYSPFGEVLFSIHPFLTFLVCVPTRMLAGWIPGLIYKIICKTGKKTLASGIACFLVPLLNTLFFMSVLVICFYNTEYIQSIALSLKATNPFTFVVLFVGINGLVEMLCGMFISFPISKTLDYAIYKK